MSEQTISFSSGSDGEVTPAHQKRKGDLPKNCERELVNRNVCIYDGGDLKEHFNDYFKECRDEYNAKQKRKARKVADDYYEAVINQTETYGKGDKAEKAVYHDILQIGNRKTNGITDDSFSYKHYKKLKEKDEKQASDYCLAHLNNSNDLKNSVQILTNIGNRLCSDEFPNIVVHSCYIHLDEPNGTPHLDVIYSIVALNEERGPSKRVSMNKGLSQMGFTYIPDCTQLEQFRIFMKQKVEDEMKKYGMQRVDINEGRKREKTQKFVARTAKECESHEKEAEALIADLEARKANIKKEAEDEIEEEKQKAIEKETKELQEAKQRYLDAEQKALNVAVVNKQFYDNEFGKFDEYRNQINELIYQTEQAIVDAKKYDDERSKQIVQELTEQKAKLEAVEMPEYSVPEEMEEIVNQTVEHYKDVNREYEETERRRKSVEAERKPEETSKPLPKKMTTKEELEAQRRAINAYMDEWNEEAQEHEEQIDNDLNSL